MFESRCNRMNKDAIVKIAKQHGIKNLNQTKAALCAAITAELIREDSKDDYVDSDDDDDDYVESDGSDTEEEGEEEVEEEAETEPYESEEEVEEEAETEPYESEEEIGDEDADERCMGHTFANLIKMDSKEIDKVFRKNGIKEGIPADRNEQIEYLCSLDKQGRCNPAENKWCKSGFVCDVNNTPGVCVSNDFMNSAGSEFYEGKDKTMERWFTPDGHAIIGTSNAIAKVQEMYSGAPSEDDMGQAQEDLLEYAQNVSDDELKVLIDTNTFIRDIVEDDGFWRTRLESRYPEDVKKPTETWRQAYRRVSKKKPSMAKMPEEGEEVPDIGDLFANVDADSQPNLDDIDATRRQIFACFGIPGFAPK